MNRAGLYQLIEDPSQLAGLPLAELERLRDAYPWFSAAQVLLAKAYQINDDHRFTDQLHQAALYTGNRRSLHAFIRRELNPASATLDEEVSIQREPEEMTAPTDQLIVPESTPEPVSIDLQEEPEAPLTSEEQSVFFELFREPENTPAATVEEDTQALEKMARLIVDEDQQSGSGSLGKSVPEPEIELNFRLAPDAFPTTQTDEKESDQSAEHTEDTQERMAIDLSAMDELDKAILAQAVSSSIAIEVSETDLASEDARPIPIEVKKPVDMPVAPEEISDPYARWLAERARQLHYQVDEEAPVTIQPVKPELESSNETDSPVSKTERPRLTPPDPKSRQQDLIERFMRAEPRITPAKSGEYDTVNIAKESLEEDFDLVTETMAILFARQGKIERARKVYKRLMELYPEKSVYFAAQLKNLNATKKT